MEERRTLRSGFLRSAQRFAERPALELAGRALTYAELHARAASIAATLEAEDPEPAAPLTAVLGHRSFSAFAGILGALLRGHGYVPLNPAFPSDRTQRMLVRSGATALVADATAAPQLETVLEGVDRPLRVLLPDEANVEALAQRFPKHRFIGSGAFRAASSWRPRPVDPNGIAYLLFTSGSTGEPKGVMVAHRNVTHFLDFMVERYGVDERDRLSQTFDLTFDLSVFDMFVAWERGACVCVPTQGQKLLPGKYVSDCALTIWFSVPSTVALMNRLRMLKPGRYPTLRWALFCGEALPVESVQRWAEAAPSATIENLYGPTELTIACTLYRWRGDASLPECELGVVPIGSAYPGMDVLVADEALREVPAGETGELLMTGPQLSLGYYCDPARTAAAFVTPPGKQQIYYRTGDRVRRPRGDAPLVYLGRVDNQIKIQGYRVELGEIEAAARNASGIDQAVAIGWPVTSSGADGIVVFVGDDTCDVVAVREQLSARLPAYMQPSQVRASSHLPLNANGKVDRKALRAMLDAEAAQTAAARP